MLKKNRPQLDMFDYIIFKKLVPKDHLLIKIDSIIDFSFIYDLVKDRYSPIGRGSKDPAMMVKIFLLEYLYRLSDVEVVKRIQTDIVFRWFLNLGIDDQGPDDTTLSYFRVKRLTEDHFEAFFTEIVKKCIEKDLIKSNRFIIDEDNEIILASVQTPFNTGDGKKLIELLEKTEKQVGLKPKELSADKAYGETENRAHLKDAQIITNIAFYKESSRKNQHVFKISDFVFSADFNSVTCPNGQSTETYKITHNKSTNRDMKQFQFEPKRYGACPLIRQCIHILKNGKFQNKGRKLDVFLRYDAVLQDLARVATEEFTIAYNKRYKVERRFAAMVRNHGLRRCRYLRLKGAKIHITMANMACNIVRMVNLLCPPTKKATA